MVEAYCRRLGSLGAEPKTLLRDFRFQGTRVYSAQCSANANTHAPLELLA